MLGGAAGTVGEMAVLPALVVRTRMMVQGADSSARQYKGFVHCFRTMIKEEGIGSFYKGAGVNLAFTPIARGLFTAGFEATRATIGEGTPVKDFAAGTVAQLLSSFAYVPRDIVVERCAIDGQLKNQVGSTASSLTALRTILAHEGTSGFYRAYMPHQFVWIPFNGLFFTFLGQLSNFESGIGLDARTNYLLNVLNTFLAAAGASILTNPIDVIKTRLQVSGANPEALNYRGPIDCLKQLLRHEGAGALFAGLVGRIAFVGPNFALFLPTYDLLKRLTREE